MNIFNILLGIHVFLAVLSLIALKEKVLLQGRSNLKAWLSDGGDINDIDDLVIFRCWLPSKEISMVLCAIPLLLGTILISILVTKNDIWKICQEGYLEDTLEVYIKFATIVILRCYLWKKEYTEKKSPRKVTKVINWFNHSFTK